MSIRRYATGKVGDDLVLQSPLYTSAGVAVAIESATITIVHENGTRTVDSAAASSVSSNRVQYVFVPTVAGEYVVEWHLVHSSGLDLYDGDIWQLVEPRRAA